MIVYTNVCLGCFHKKRLRELKNFCQQNGIEFEERRVTYNKKWQDEARQIGGVMPFVYHEGKVVGLYDDWERLL